MVANRFNKIQKTIEAKPLHAVLGVLVVCLMIYGLYLFSPFYVPTPFSSIAHVFDYRESQYVMGVLYSMPGVVFFTGLLKRSARLVRWSATLAFTMYIFSTILRLVSVGPFPVIWLFMLALAITAGVIRISLELRAVNGGG